MKDGLLLPYAVTSAKDSYVRFAHYRVCLWQTRVGRCLLLSPWILSRITNTLRLVVADFVYRYADVLEYFVELLSKVTECNGTVVWEVLFDEYVAVEASHFWNSENTDTSE